MQIKRGIPASPGVAIGPAFVLGAENIRIPQRLLDVEKVDAEVERLRTALQGVCREIEQNERLATERIGSQYAAIFAAHLMIARDEQLIREIEELIRKRLYSAEHAVSSILKQYARRFQNLGDKYLAERAADVLDLERRVLRELLGQTRVELSHISSPALILAHNLTPSETANLDTRNVLGFATEAGGSTSHTAILAGALEIPAVVGVGNFLSDVAGGEMVVIDGQQGTVIIDPDEETLARYRESSERFRSFSRRLESLRQLPSVTQDGVAVSLMGNIEFPAEAEHAKQRGAEGIGLYRTEFLYLETQKEPTEADHYDAYMAVLKAFPDQPVVIRTLDLGADKLPIGLATEYGDGINPALSVRSIRLSLMHPRLFKTQLRACLRAAVHGDLRIMFPLISTMLEFRQARMILGEVIEDLAEEGVPFKRDVPLGIMVETPAAALLAEEFAREVDFFSIGTNDLIQYTLAVDRADPQVTSLYRAGDPSIARLLRMVVSAARKHQISVSVCGQMSGDPLFVPLLVGLGFRQFSVTPHSIPELKEVIRNLTIARAEQIASRADSFDSARDVEGFLRAELKKICPESLSLR